MAVICDKLSTVLGDAACRLGPTVCGTTVQLNLHCMQYENCAVQTYKQGHFTSQDGEVHVCVQGHAGKKLGTIQYVLPYLNKGHTYAEFQSACERELVIHTPQEPS